MGWVSGQLSAWADGRLHLDEVGNVWAVYPARPIDACFTPNYRTSQRKVPAVAVDTVISVNCIFYRPVSRWHERALEAEACVKPALPRVEAAPNVHNPGLRLIERYAELFEDLHRSRQKTFSKIGSTPPGRGR
jgi:hypothetical protein